MIDDRYKGPDGKDFPVLSEAGGAKFTLADIAAFDRAASAAGPQTLHDADLEGVDLHASVRQYYAGLANKTLRETVFKNADPIARRIALRPMMGVVRQEFAALCDYLHFMGYTIRPSGEEYLGVKERTAYIRFDIHLRDVLPAYGFIDYQNAMQIYGTHFIEWGAYDYSAMDKLDFQLLGDDRTEYTKFGLHVSPVDNYLNFIYTKCNPANYNNFLKSLEFEKLVNSWVAKPALLDSFHDAVLNHLGQTYIDFKKALKSDYPYVAAHGGLINQIHRNSSDFSPDAKAIIDTLYAEAWMNEERLKKVGLLGDVERQRKNGGFAILSDGGGKIGNLAAMVVKYAEKGAAIQLLLHPYQWFAARREGALSSLRAYIK